MLATGTSDERRFAVSEGEQQDGRSVRASRREPPAEHVSRREGGHVQEMQGRRLLLAVGEVVGKDGLEAASVGRVCEQAGVSRRTFYELFEDREACLLAAFQAAVERISEGVVNAFASTGHWHERVRGALTAMLESFDEDPDKARLCIIEAPRAGPLVLERRRSLIDVLVVAVDEGRCEARTGSEPPPLTAQGIVGGVLSVIHARLQDTLSDGKPRPMVELVGPVMGMIVHPYLGPTTARKELERRSEPAPPRKSPRGDADPFKDLPIRFTYRTAIVLATIASDPGASNRYIANSSGITDNGQISRLLRRLHVSGLIENHTHRPGEANAWTLTDRGQAIHTAITGQTARP